MRPEPFDKRRTAPVEARPSTSAVLSLSKGSTHIPADSATLLARFSERLRDAGVAVSPDQMIRLATLVTLGVPSTVEELYWCARVSLLRSTADIAAFDAVFALVFRGMVDVAESRGDSTQIPLPPQRDFPFFDEEPGANVPSKGRFEASESADSDDVGRPIPTFASSEERLTEVDFARLTTDELAALTPLLRMLWVNQPRRLSRRRRRHRRGDRLDVRASLRHSTRSGGDPAVPIRRTRKWTPRRLVALLDISGSMEPYARAYLDLLWGAATRAHAEVFVFGTRLTRLTRALRNANPDLALERAAAVMPDWSGGTRIGRALREFMNLYGRRGMARGAVVLIVSDGWERDDPSVLAQQMVALCRHAHRIVWANPRAAAPGFAPLAAGMAAALPHVDSFISGHSADALAEVVRALGASQPRRSIGIPTVRHCSSRRVSPLVNRI
jgi:uncharacterized protein with von Willebrand factor type A (vWA) domain